VESRADYSVHLEFGTKNMRARPFLQPALEENRPKIKSMYRRLKARGV
jgi:HK97 gp10 family phage protein